MSPVLKVLSLITIILCVVVLFSIFVLGVRINQTQKNPKIVFRTIQKEGIFSNLSQSEKKVSSTTFSGILMPLTVLGGNNNFFDYGSTSSQGVDFTQVEIINGPYYKYGDALYFSVMVFNDCLNTEVRKIIALPTIPTDTVNISRSGDTWMYTLKNNQDAFINFYKVTTADPNTLSYVGMGNRHGNAFRWTDTYWYKDTAKVLVIKTTIDTCKGVTIEESSSGFESADPATFTYLGQLSQNTYPAYAQDKKYFYDDKGVLSSSTTPLSCTGDFFKDCLPLIQKESRIIQ